MIPAWKIRREFARIRQQFRYIDFILNGRRKTSEYDRSKAKLVQVWDGKVGQTDKIAIILIYQPNGVLTSTLDLCVSLLDHGYSPLIVSNAPLQESDLESLLNRCWRVMQRPNFGYDFGGYRDGVFHLWENNIVPEMLAILNDSVWLIPTEATSIWSEHSSDNSLTVRGAVSRMKNGKRWLESYFFLISKATFQHSAFVDFWNNYVLTDSKFIVIRRGERDFGVSLERGGIELNPFANRDEFMSMIGGLSADQILKVLTYAARPDNAGALRDRNLIISSFKNSDSWIATAYAHIEASLKQDGSFSQFGFAAMKWMGLPFLKKSNDPSTFSLRAKYLQAVENGDLPAPSAAILAEVSAQQTGPLRKTHFSENT